MDYSSDKPIEKIEDDLLGRADFSKNLAKAIYNYKDDDGLVVGIYGKWGTGKTSIINMMENEINNISESKKGEPLIVKFSPWNYSDKNDLIRLFFEKLKIEISKSPIEKVNNGLKKSLSNYGEVLNSLSILHTPAGIISPLLKIYAETNGGIFTKNPDLDEARKSLEKELRDSKEKIIIIIDDIDRLSNSQIKDVFQLVKQLGDFPNIIYVLSMDRDIVANALTEVQKIDGNTYLEKIVQIPFQIPRINRRKLDEIFLKELEKIIKNIQIDLEIDDNYWYRIFENCIKPYIANIRDINRILNVFQFKYEALHEETSFEDMIAITTIEVMEPVLYNWIANNKYSVCNGNIKPSIYKNNEKNYHKIYSDKFKSIGLNPEKSIKFVSSIFPRFFNDVKGIVSKDLNSEKKSKMRISDEKRFDLYFSFNINEIEIPRSLINQCIEVYDKNQLIEGIREINKENKIIYFLEELRTLIGNIPQDRLTLIASELIYLQDEFKGETLGVFTPKSAQYLANRVIFDIIRKISTKETRYNFIKAKIENLSKKELPVLSGIITLIDAAYNTEDTYNQIISKDNLEEIKNLYIKKIREISKKQSVLYMNGFYFAFYFWRKIDKEGSNKYLERVFKDEVDKLKFICLTAIIRNSSGKVRKLLTEDSFKDYISKDKLYNSIKELDKNKLSKFTQDEQKILARFFLGYNKETYEVDDKEVNKLIDEWKKE